MLPQHIICTLGCCGCPGGIHGWCYAGQRKGGGLYNVTCICMNITYRYLLLLDQELYTYNLTLQYAGLYLSSYIHCAGCLISRSISTFDPRPMPKRSWNLVGHPVTRYRVEIALWPYCWLGTKNMKCLDASSQGHGLRALERERMFLHQNVGWN